jgi:hypothetical protein
VPHSSAFFAEGWEAIRQTPNDRLAAIQKIAMRRPIFALQKQNPRPFRPEVQPVQLQIDYRPVAHSSRFLA